MKILHIAQLSADMTTGVNVVVPQHIRAQSKFADVFFYNVAQVEIPSVSKEQINIATTEELYGFLLVQHIDIVIFHEAYRPVYLAISSRLRKMGIPYIIIPHGELSIESQKKKWIKKKIANLLLFNKFINNASALQCLSQQEEKNTKFKPIKFIGTNGMDIPQTNKKEFYKGDIVYIGRLEMQIKGIDILLDAALFCAETLRKNNVKINIYGPDVLGRGDAIRLIIEKYKIGDIVQLYGPVFGVEKENILLNSRFFIQTSRTEGMPMGILEALAYGIPCLITRGAALGDAINEYNAGWVAETEAKSVAETIAYALNIDKEYEKKSAHARKIIEEKFQWDTIAQNTIEMYKGALIK